MAEVEYNTEDGTASIPVTCSPEDSNPPAQVSARAHVLITKTTSGDLAEAWRPEDLLLPTQHHSLKVSALFRTSDSSDLSEVTGDFLCTALNSVGPSLTASLKVSVKEFPRCVNDGFFALILTLGFCSRRLQIEANDYRSSVRLHFPLS